MDLADRCSSSVEALTGRGASFASAPQGPGPSSRKTRPCACGGHPAYAPHPPLRSGGDLLEILRCPVCGNQAGPAKARQNLATEWELGGWDNRGSKQ